MLGASGMRWLLLLTLQLIKIEDDRWIEAGVHIFQYVAIYFSDFAGLDIFVYTTLFF